MYLEVDEDFPSHPKSVRLCSSLMNPIGWAYMIKLWSWARKYQKDGDLAAYEPSEIEYAVGWAIADGKFYAAAVRVGFIDEVKDSSGAVTTRCLHNWMKRSGAGIKKAEDEAARKRVFRLHKSGNCDKATCQLCLSEAGEATGERTGDKRQQPSDGRPEDAARTVEAGQESSEDGSSQGKTRPVKSRSGSVSFPPLSSASSGQTHAKSNPCADGPAILPPRIRHPIARVGTLTPAFLAVFERYPRGDKRMEASQIFAELADEYPGGEAALSVAILAAFDAGMLKRHPYHGPNATRPCFDTVLAERRWEDPPSAPDDAPSTAGRSKTDGNLHVARDFLAKQAVAK
jgi:hypothetical protein